MNTKVLEPFVKYFKIMLEKRQDSERILGFCPLPDKSGEDCAIRVGDFRALANAVNEPTAEEKVAEFRGFLLSLDNDRARFEAISDAKAGICNHCGNIGSRCQCWNDE